MGIFRQGLTNANHFSFALCSIHSCSLRFLSCARMSECVCPFLFCVDRISFRFSWFTLAVLPHPIECNPERLQRIFQSISSILRLTNRTHDIYTRTIGSVVLSFIETEHIQHIRARAHTHPLILWVNSHKPATRTHARTAQIDIDGNALLTQTFCSPEKFISFDGRECVCVHITFSSFGYLANSVHSFIPFGWGQ